MIIDELRQKLKDAEADITTIKSFWQDIDAANRIASLEQQVNAPDFWKHPDRDTILTSHRALKHIAEAYPRLSKNYTDNCELIELFNDNEKQLEEMKSEIFSLCKQVSILKIELLLKEENDSKNCYLSINAGAGGTESQDWAEILSRMYLRFCEREGFRVDVLDYQTGEAAGIKSATLFIKGMNAHGFLKAEAGIHRLVRISPYDANKRRHTSFAGITIIPEVEDAKIEINELDLRIDTYRASGAGGQHVNKTDSAVRITHIPTGIVTQCQNERSQLQNKQTALKMLRAKLIQKQDDEKRSKIAGIEKKKIEWGSQIRSYVLHPYKMVKDHRTDCESHQPDSVLDGDLMSFIEKYLLMINRENHT